MARTKEFDKSEALLKALDFFWQHGYHATSMEDLVGALGINRASLYGTFGGKKELFNMALRQYQDHNLQLLEQILEQSHSLEAGIRAMFDATFKGSKESMSRGCFVVNTSTELAPEESDVKTAILENKQRFIKLLSSHILRAQKSGEVRSNTSAAELATFLYTIYNGLQVLVRLGPEKKEIQSTLALALASFQFAT